MRVRRMSPYGVANVKVAWWETARPRASVTRAQPAVTQNRSWSSRADFETIAFGDPSTSGYPVTPRHS